MACGEVFLPAGENFNNITFPRIALCPENGTREDPWMKPQYRRFFAVFEDDLCIIYHNNILLKGQDRKIFHIIRTKHQISFYFCTEFKKT
jgi:hypothetical protein